MHYLTKSSCAITVVSFLTACGGGSTPSSPNNQPSTPTPQPPATNNVTFTVEARDYISSLSLFVPDINTFMAQQALEVLEFGATAVIEDDELQCISNIDVEGDAAQPTQVVLDYETCTLESGFIINEGLVTIQNNIADNTQHVTFVGSMTIDGTSIGYESELNIEFFNRNNTETLMINNASLLLDIDGTEERVNEFNIVKSIDLDNKTYTFQYDMSVDSEGLGGRFECNVDTFGGKLARPPGSFSIACSSGTQSTNISSDELSSELTNSALFFASFPFKFGELDVTEYAFAFEEITLDSELSYYFPKFLPEQHAIIATNNSKFVYYDWQQQHTIELNLPASNINAMSKLGDNVAFISSLNGMMHYNNFSLTNPSISQTSIVNLIETLNYEGDTSGFVDKIQEFGEYFLLSYVVRNENDNLRHALLLVDKHTGALVSDMELAQTYNEFYAVNEQRILGRHIGTISSPYTTFELLGDTLTQGEDTSLEFFLNCLKNYKLNTKISIFSNDLFNFNTSTLTLNSKIENLPFSFNCEDVTLGANEYGELTIVRDGSTFSRADFYWYDADSLEFISRSGQGLQSTLLDVSANSIFEVKYAAKDYYILISPSSKTMAIVGRFSDKVFGGQ
ncbi:MAG: hypothetical protein ACFHVJ_15340 [Aestuariibacter sp.]